MTRSGTRLLRAAALAVLVGAAPACDGPAEPVEMSCDGGPRAGVLSLWTACAGYELAHGSIIVTLSNRLDETVWFYHECGSEVPWPTVLEQDGTWSRLLPTNFSLPIECEHVMEIEPGADRELLMSTHRVVRPGTYRAEMIVARECMDVHDPTSVPHACGHVDFLVSSDFELR